MTTLKNISYFYSYEDKHYFYHIKFTHIHLPSLLCRIRTVNDFVLSSSYGNDHVRNFIDMYVSLYVCECIYDRIIKLKRSLQ